MVPLQLPFDIDSVQDLAVSALVDLATVVVVFLIVFLLGKTLFVPAVRRVLGSRGFDELVQSLGGSVANALVWAAAVAIGFAFGGSVIIETIFSWPGLGKMMFDATLAQDFPLAQSTFLLLAAVIIFMNFLADALSVYVDPRTSASE